MKIVIKKKFSPTLGINIYIEHISYNSLYLITCIRFIWNSRIFQKIAPKLIFCYKINYKINKYKHTIILKYENRI